jgi:energy-coupling factor transporter ATP-binding protein EcfA2
VEKALQQTGLWEVRAKPTHFLSVGQKKRAAIAGVLAMDPEVVVLDEPTANLDPKHVRNIMDILSALNEEGKTVVISSHDLDGVLAWADYLFVLKKGRLLGEGPPQEIFSNDFLLAEAELEKPLLWQVYQALAARGLLKEDCLAGPRRLGDILADLKENNKDRKR